MTAKTATVKNPRTYPIGPDLRESATLDWAQLELMIQNGLPAHIRQVESVTFAPSRAVALERYLAAGLHTRLSNLRRQQGSAVDALREAFPDERAVLIYHRYIPGEPIYRAAQGMFELCGHFRKKPERSGERRYWSCVAEAVRDAS